MATQKLRPAMEKYFCYPLPPPSDPPEFNVDGAGAVRPVSQEDCLLRGLPCNIDSGGSGGRQTAKVATCPKPLLLAAQDEGKLQNGGRHNEALALTPTPTPSGRGCGHPSVPGVPLTVPVQSRYSPGTVPVQSRYSPGTRFSQAY